MKRKKQGLKELRVRVAVLRTIARSQEHDNLAVDVAMSISAVPVRDVKLLTRTPSPTMQGVDILEYSAMGLSRTSTHEGH